MLGGVKQQKCRGVALLITLSAGVILILLAFSLLTLYLSDLQAQDQQQQALKAYWNARAGLERYCAWRRLPPGGVYDFSERGRCQVQAQGKDLVFIGQFGQKLRRIRLLERNPALRLEEL